ncbi:MAG: response regulator [Calditrichaeota bacterium]|nr:MAG: response regulator [Calditrichota bacterium]
MVNREKGKSVRVLYLEDERGLAHIFQKKLEKAGFEVALAISGEEGLQKLEANDYDVLVVDYNLPGMNGLEVIRHLARKNRLIPTIMLTSTGNEQIAVEAMKAGAADYIVKEPGYLELLPIVINQILYEKHLEEQKRQAELALKKSEETNRALLSALPDTMLLLNANGEILTVKITDNSPFFLKKEMVGYSLKKVFPPGIYQQMFQALTDVLTNGGMVHFEFFVEHDEVRYYESRLVLCGEREVLAIIRDITPRRKVELEKEKLIQELQEALKNIKQLEGLIPICASCKKIRDDRGYWNQLELYLEEHAGAMFSHSVCPECMQKLYPEWISDKKKDSSD